jgi:TonB-linked SusC/RagA family outer membrane protein
MLLEALCKFSHSRNAATKKLLLIMKLTAIILLSACLTASANGYTQNITLSGKDMPIEKVFKSIETQTAYVFFYNYDLLRDSKPITINVQNENLQNVLKKIFKDQPLDYVIKQQTIFITKKASGLNEAINYEPFPIDVHGRVVNEKGEPVIGASVQVKGDKEKGTSTDADGYFTLKDVEENATLIISGANIESFEIRVGGKTDLATIHAKIKIIAGETVTIEANTGYQKVKPNEVTGSLVVLTKEQLDKRVAPDILSKLEGITNGLVFNKDPLTGQNQLRIRGESTIFGYTNPLIVVDNFPYPYEKINDINPNDVASITILKDAAAASIWGSQAGNGVIVITTKRGKINQALRLELNANTTLTKKADLFYIPYIKSTDYIDFEAFLFSKGFYGGALSNLNMPAVSPVVDILYNRSQGLISSSDSASQINVLRNYDWRNDYLKYIYRNSTIQQYQLNLSGGSSKMSYYFSGGYDKNLSNIIGNSNSRLTFYNTTNFNLIKNLELQTEINYLENSATYNGNATTLNIFPYSRLVDDNGQQLPVHFHRATWEDTISHHGFLDWHYYPLQERALKNSQSKGYTTKVGTSIRYKIFKGLSIEAGYQYYHSIVKNTEITSERSYAIRDRINMFAILDNNKNFIGSNYPKGGLFDAIMNDVVGQTGRFKAEFSHKWNSHSIAVLTGADVSEIRSEGNSFRLYGYNENSGSFVTPNPITIYPIYPSGSSTIVDQNLGLSYFSKLNRLRSFYGNFSYAFKERYSVSGSARIDQANIFGANANHRGTPLWSVGGKWNINKETFYKMHSIPVLDLRVTYGYQGNFSPNAVAVVTLKYGNPATYSGLATAQISNFPNPDLGWEKSGQLNVGADFALKNNRLIGTIEYFKKNGKDLIGETKLDPTTGIRTLTGNFSDMKSKGVDVSLIVQIIHKRAFNWTSTLIFNYVAEKITRYDVPNSNSKYLDGYTLTSPKAGYPVHGFFSYQWGGLDPNTGGPRIVLGDTLNSSYTVGTFNSLQVSDLKYSGRYNPPYAGSFNNSISWKNLTLSFDITYKLGHYFRRRSINYAGFQYDWRSGDSDYGLRWKKQGDEAFTDIPSYVYNAPSERDQFYLKSTVLVEKADHFRLQFINLNYQFTNPILQKLRIQNLNIYFYANNLGIIWKANKHGVDPDYPYLDYPPSKSFSFGLKAGF